MKVTFLGVGEAFDELVVQQPTLRAVQRRVRLADDLRPDRTVSSVFLQCRPTHSLPLRCVVLAVHYPSAASHVAANLGGGMALAKRGKISWHLRGQHSGATVGL